MAFSKNIVKSLRPATSVPRRHSRARSSMLSKNSLGVLCASCADCRTSSGMLNACRCATQTASSIRSTARWEGLALSMPTMPKRLQLPKRRLPLSLEPQCGAACLPRPPAAHACCLVLLPSCYVAADWLLCCCCLLQVLRLSEKAGARTRTCNGAQGGKGNLRVKVARHLQGSRGCEGVQVP